MNPYKEDGPCARLSFDPAYCKRCTGPPSVNDGYITGTGCRTAHRRRPQADRTAKPLPGPATTHRRMPAARPAHRVGAGGAPRNAIGTIETLVRQRSNGAFIMRD